MSKKGLLFIVSGFSGAGKGTIVSKFLETHSEVALSISSTTREPRSHEKQGVEYNFISTQEFEDLIDSGNMLEYAKYVNCYYGTPKTFVMEKIDAGIDVILEIEMQGALKVKGKYQDAIMIFVVPPHGGDLKERLLARGTENREKISDRLRRSFDETDLMHHYEYILVNDELEEAVRQFEAIRLAEKAKYRHAVNLSEQLKKEIEQVIERD